MEEKLCRTFALVSTIFHFTVFTICLSVIVIIDYVKKTVQSFRGRKKP